MAPRNQPAGSRPPTRPRRGGRNRGGVRVGQDPLYKEPFRTQRQRERGAEAYAERLVGPESEIYDAARRQEEGAANIGQAYGQIGSNLTESLGAALGALGGATSGMSGANIQSGLAAADVLRSTVPTMQGQTMVAGTRNLIGQKTREAIEDRGERRRKAYAERLNELYKRDVDKATARESSRLTRESLGSKEKIAAANLAQQQYEFNIKTDIDYKKLEQNAQKIKQSEGDNADALLKEAGTRMKSLLNKTVKGSDATLGFTLRVYDPIRRTWERRWYAGTEQQARQQARTEFGDDLTDADIQVQGAAVTNPNPGSTSYSKYSTQQVRNAMVTWIVANVPGYNRKKAIAWVNAQPEMQLAG